jgi:sRNA-binding carbon storage regulator CsrA
VRIGIGAPKEAAVDRAEDHDEKRKDSLSMAAQETAHLSDGPEALAGTE